MIALVDGGRGQREGVGTGTGFRQRVGPHRSAGQPRQIAASSAPRSPSAEWHCCTMVFCTSTTTPAEGSTAEISSIARIALEEVAALAAVLFGNLDAHQPQFEQLADEVFAKDAGFVHLAHVRRDLFPREIAHGGLEQLFFFVERGERRERQYRADTLPATYGDTRFAIGSAVLAIRRRRR